MQISKQMYFSVWFPMLKSLRWENEKFFFKSCNAYGDRVFTKEWQIIEYIKIVISFIFINPFQNVRNLSHVYIFLER